MACTPMDISHTGENIMKVLKDQIEAWEVTGKVGPCVRDNASNMVATFKAPHAPDASYIDSSNGQYPLVSIGCLNHTLQLAINDEIYSMASVDNLLTKCRSVVTHANHSTNFYNVFYEKQKMSGITDRRSLKQDVATRYLVNLAGTFGTVKIYYFGNVNKFVQPFAKLGCRMLHWKWKVG